MTRILVIEDNAKNLKLVRDVLQHAGYDVFEARTGEEGVAAAASCQPDLVLMDLQLPGIDGTEALRRLRQAGGRRIPVVAVTAFAMKGDEEKIRQGGCEGYIAKPISIAGFMRVVEHHLPEAT